MKNKLLWIVLLGLGGLYLYTVNAPDKDRSFSKDLMDIQADDIQKIEFSSRDKDAFQLIRSGDHWNIVQGIQEKNADNHAVTSLLSQFSRLKAERIISKSKDKWETYAVTDSSGSSIKVTTMNGQTSELIIGKFDFNQEKKQAKTYVRKGDNDETYLVDGFLNMSMSQDAVSYRNQDIVNISKIDSVYKITYTDHNQGLTMHWERGITQIKSDSISISYYLKNIAILKDNTFSDKIPVTDPVYTIEIQSTNQPLIQVDAYEHNPQMYLMGSSQNPNTYFESLLDGSFEKVFTNFVKIR